MVQLLKDEGTSSRNKESSTSSKSYQTNPTTSFERTYSVVHGSSENSTSTKGTSCVRSCEEEVSSNGIFERRRDETFTNKEESTLGKNHRKILFKQRR